MPYITPISTPAETICWRVFIPNDVRTIAAFLGQLSDLYKPELWEQTDGVSVEDTIALFDTVYETLESRCDKMIGVLVHYVTSQPPNNVLECDGTQYLRVDYPDLYAALPTNYIIDADNFIVPDIQDKFIMASGIDHVPEDVGGESEHTLTIEELPAHSHNYNYPNASVDFKSTGVPDLSALANPPIAISTSSVGSDVAHNNLPPYVAHKVGIVAK